MAHAITHSYDLTPEEAIREIKADRQRRSWIALGLFLLSAGALFTSFYLSYRDVPAPASPANSTPALLDPYH
jgi:hypothetical protein